MNWYNLGIQKMKGYKMKLLTKEIINKLETTKYNREELTPNDAPVLVKFFNPVGGGTWYALEGEKIIDGYEDARTGELKDDWVFYGFVDLGNPDYAEYGEFLYSELLDYKGDWGLGIERDMHYSGTNKDIKEKYKIKI